MNKLEALKILIENSYIFGQVTKDKLMVLVETMSDEELTEWGKLLSEEQKFVEENKEEILTKIDSQ